MDLWKYKGLSSNYEVFNLLFKNLDIKQIEYLINNNFQVDEPFEKFIENPSSYYSTYMINQENFDIENNKNFDDLDWDIDLDQQADIW